MCQNLIKIEETNGVQLDDIYHELSDIKDQVSFLNTVTRNEDLEGLTSFENYSNGKAILIESIENKLQIVIEKIEKIEFKKEGDES